MSFLTAQIILGTLRIHSSVEFFENAETVHFREFNDPSGLHFQDLGQRDAKDKKATNKIVVTPGAETVIVSGCPWLVSPQVHPYS